MRTRAVTVVACAAALAGCGTGAHKESDVPQIRSVVEQFARADGPRACSLLSPNALVNVYGGFTRPVAEARATCLQRSARFKGQRVRIESLVFVDPKTAKVTALNPKGTVAYTVTVRKYGPSWRIDAISQQKAD